MNAETTIKKFKKMALSMARSASTEHVLMSEDDLYQEAQVAIWKATKMPNFPASEEEQGKLIRACILNAFRDLARQTSDEVQTVSLDEVLGTDESESEVTRYDSMGEEAVAELVLLKREKVKTQSAVASARISAIKKEGEVKKSESRIEEIVKLKASGLSGAEIGKQLGITKQAVNKTLAKLRTKAA